MRKTLGAASLSILLPLGACASLGQTSPECPERLVEVRPELTAQMAEPPELCPVELPGVNADLAASDAACAGAARFNADLVCALQTLVLGLPPPHCPLPPPRASPG